MSQRRRFEDAALDETDAENEGEISQGQAGRNLVDLLLYLRIAGKLQSNYVCVIAHWAHLAGAEGELNEIAWPPGKASTRYQKVLDKAMGFETQTEEEQLLLETPCWAPHLAERVVESIRVSAPHEVLQAELEEDEGVAACLRDAHAEGLLPQAYDDHPIVQRGGAGTHVPARTLPGRRGLF